MRPSFRISLAEPARRRIDSGQDRYRNRKLNDCRNAYPLGTRQFFENNFYNDHAANAPGLDTAYYEYLSQKIARAVIRAYQMKKPAKIATGKIEIWNVTRNRSLESYRANKNISSENSPGIYEAINPDLYLMRIDALDDNGQYRPLASISSFSIHGTAVPRDNELYHGDVFAFMEREVEFGIQNTYKISWTPIHAAFNGTHADNSPNYSRQSFEEARRIGTIIGKKAWKLFCSLEGQLKNDIVIRFRTREINLFPNHVPPKYVCVTGLLSVPRLPQVLMTVRHR